MGRNYLWAIYSPFSFILFYEVLELVAAIPYSTVQSVASQFEIVSLIFVRGFFKDIADMDDLGAIRQPSAAMIPPMTEVWASLWMFLLVTVFQHVSLSWSAVHQGRLADLEPKTTILIRFSLTPEEPYGALLAVLGMLFGIVTMLIYSYNTKLPARYPGSEDPARKRQEP